MLNFWVAFFFPADQRLPLFLSPTHRWRLKEVYFNVCGTVWKHELFSELGESTVTGCFSFHTDSQKCETKRPNYGGAS